MQHAGEAVSDDDERPLPPDPSLYTWSPQGNDIRIPLPRQPEPAKMQELAQHAEQQRAAGEEPGAPKPLFTLQRPTPEEIGQLTDPYGEALRTRLLVLNRWTFRESYDENRPTWTRPVAGVWGPYQIHGDGRPSLFKTWARARAQALGGATDQRRDRTLGPRPGAVLLFDLRAMPCVTSEDEMLTCLGRPYASRCWDKESEHEFAERMATEWMAYAERTR